VLDDGTKLTTLREAVQYLARTVPKAELNHDMVLSFDEAAIAVMKARRDHKVREAAMTRTLKIVAAILADADSLDDALLAPMAP